MEVSVKNLLDILSNSVPRIPIKTKGIIFKDKGYYKLTDNSNYIINLDIPDTIPVLLNTMTEVNGVIESYISPKISANLLKIEVKSLKPVESEKEIVVDEQIANEITKIIQEKTSDKPFFGYFFTLLEQQDIINVAVIHGKNAQVQKDFSNAFIKEAGDYSYRVNMIFLETTLSNDDELAETLLASSVYDAVFLLRGGGSKIDLSSIGSIKTIEVIVKNNIPLFIALGHSNDKNLSWLQKVADYEFPTPSLAGTNFGDVVRYVSEMQYKNKTLEHQKEQLVKLNEQLISMQNELQSKNDKIQNIEQKEKSLNAISNEINKIKEEMDKIVKENTKLQSQVKILSDENYALRFENNNYVEKIKYYEQIEYSYNNTVEKLQNKINTLDNTIKKLQLLLFISTIAGFVLGILFIKLFQ